MFGGEYSLISSKYSAVCRASSKRNAGRNSSALALSKSKPCSVFRRLTIGLPKALITIMKLCPIGVQRPPFHAMSLKAFYGVCNLRAASIVPAAMRGGAIPTSEKMSVRYTRNSAVVSVSAMSTVTAFQSGVALSALAAVLDAVSIGVVASETLALASVVSSRRTRRACGPCLFRCILHRAHAGNRSCATRPFCPAASSELTADVRFGKSEKNSFIHTRTLRWNCEASIRSL